jgi:tungstate transport system permease protein
MDTLASVTTRSLYISSVAALLAIASALGISLVLSRLSRRRFEMVLGVFEVLIGVPTTVIGLLLYMLLYPRGPLGVLGLLYTPYAIIIGEFLVALPISVMLIARHIYEVRSVVRELVLSLGGSENQALHLLVRELAPAFVSTYVSAFSRAVGELGVALIVGGGIEGVTNVLTTAIYLQTSIGNYELALQLGLVLIAITAAVAIALKVLGVRSIWRLD